VAECPTTLDVASIASHVWQELDPCAPVKALEAPVAQSISLPVALERLAEVTSALQQLRRHQEQLEHQLASLAQRLAELPAFVVRLERWSEETDARLVALGTGIESVAPPGRVATLQTVKQTAEQLGVRPSTIRRYVRNGQLTAVRLPGGGIRLRTPVPPMVNLASGEVEPAPPQPEEVDLSPRSA
jgi:excisionase family DNA binding protein